MKIVRHAKRTLFNTKEKLLVRLSKKNEIRKFEDPQRTAIYQTVTLSEQQKQEIDDLFLSHYGKKIPYTWHRHFTAFTGKFDARYIPELLFIPEFERYMNYPYHRYTEVLQDKNILPLIAAAVGVATPRAYLSACNGAYRDQQLRLISRQDAAQLLRNIGEVFAKPTVETGSGVGCGVYTFQDGVDVRSGHTVEDLLSAWGDNFVVQERLVCHKSISAIYSGSVNTFRIITYHWKGQIYRMPVIMRIGQGGSFLDNAHAGGMFIAVSDDGTLHRTAFTEFKKEFTLHPDSALVFEGHQIEGFDRVLDAVSRMHEAIPQVGVVNWDFTIREDGEPILIEANMNGGSIWLIEMAHGCGVFGENTESVLEWLRFMNRQPASEWHRYAFGRLPENELSL